MLRRLLCCSEKVKKLTYTYYENKAEHHHPKHGKHLQAANTYRNINNQMRNR